MELMSMRLADVNNISEDSLARMFEISRQQSVSCLMRIEILDLIDATQTPGESNTRNREYIAKRPIECSSPADLKRFLTKLQYAIFNRNFSYQIQDSTTYVTIFPRHSEKPPLTDFVICPNGSEA